MGDDAKDIARADVWRRFDAGEISASEVESRLRRIDRALDDDSLAGAATGTLPITSRIGRRKLGALLICLGLLVVGVSVAAAVGGPGQDRLGTGGGQTVGTGEVGAATPDPGIGVGVIAPPVPPPGVVVVGPAVGASCPALDDFQAARDASPVDDTVQPTNGALLSDPPFVPDGWDFGDDYDVVGSDSDVAMSITAGSPAPIQIAGRDLDGPQPITMRTFVYDSYDSATAAGDSGPSTALCTYNGRVVEDTTGHGLFTVVLKDAPIPPAAFSGWLRGDRRFSVEVTAASSDDADLDAAASVATAIAAAELDSALADAADGATATSVGSSRDTIPSD